MSTDKFMATLQQFPLIVSVVTVGRGGVENGLTVSWASPVSFEPPQLIICIDRRHYSVDLLESTKSFVLNVLQEDQRQLAGHFARQTLSDEDKLDDIPIQEADSGCAILSEALAYFDCDVVNSVEVGSHIVYIGEVTDCGVLNKGTPMVTTQAHIRYKKS